MKQNFRRIEFLRPKTVHSTPPQNYRVGEKAEIVDWLAAKWIAEGTARESN